jgi:hypothetical protein
MPWQKDLGWLTLRIMSIHHLDTFRYWFGDPEGIYCSVRTDPRTQFPHTDGICTYILEYQNGMRCVGIDDTWTGPAKEDCPSDIYIRWRIEGLNGLAIGDIGWCKDPYTTPSTIRFASKGQKHFEAPVWSESWFPDAFVGTMAQLLIAIEDGTEPAISGMDNLKTMALVEAAYLSSVESRSVRMWEIKSRTEAEPTEKTAEDFPSPVQYMNYLTPRAARIFENARKEAAHFNHNFVGTEHVLLGLLELGSGVAVNVLKNQGLGTDVIRKEIEKHIGTGPQQQIIGHIQFTPRVMKVIELAAKEAKALSHTYIGTEHILLALLRENGGTASRALISLGLNAAKTRKEILKELDPNFKP